MLPIASAWRRVTAGLLHADWPAGSSSASLLLAPGCTAQPQQQAQHCPAARLSTSRPCQEEAADGAQQPVTLEQQQLQALQAAAASATQHAAKATQLATLTTLAGSYRDICVALEALYMQQEGFGDPLYAAPVGAQPRPPKDPYSSSTLFPVLDVTRLPDQHASVPSGPQQYDKQYMDKITCWLQTQPPHVETSMMLRTGISLFPPQEVTYPTYTDFQAATRLMERHKSKKRLLILRKLARYQDKYQLKTWDHRKGEC